MKTRIEKTVWAKLRFPSIGIGERKHRGRCRTLKSAENASRVKCMGAWDCETVGCSSQFGPRAA